MVVDHLEWDVRLDKRLMETQDRVLDLGACFVASVIWEGATSARYQSDRHQSEYP
jgi:hypothetical protein